MSSDKYILPGSNSQTISSLQTTQTINNKAFTALSSSGTIIGGQLTPVSTNTPDIMTPSLTETVDAEVQSLYPELESINPTVIPGMGRGKGRGRGNRGARGGRATKTPKIGRGSKINSNQVVRLPTHSGAVAMLSSDFHQVGGQYIQTSTESVDGAPVVSIPDFSNAAASLSTELDSSNIVETSQVSSHQQDQVMVPMDPINSSLQLTSPPDSSQGPRVITQSIPSIKANHGFDILTQGILAASSSHTIATPRKTGISLLTGKTVSSPPSAPLLTSPPPSSLLSSSYSSDVSRVQQTLAMGHSVSQSEIDTLMKAAQAATKPTKPGQQSTQDSLLGYSLTQTAANESVNNFNVDDFLNSIKQEEVKTVENNDNVEQMDTSESTESGDMNDSKDEDEKRVFSVDESQVSAAERYRMPAELFQPDEESPEKPLRGSGGHGLGEDLPSRIFHDSEISSHEEEIPVQGNEEEIGETVLSPMKSHQTQEENEVVTESVESLIDSNMVQSVDETHKSLGADGTKISDSIDILGSSPEGSPKKKGKSKGRGRRSSKSGGRKKSESAKSDLDVGSEVENVEVDVGKASPVKLAKEEVKEESVCLKTDPDNEYVAEEDVIGNELIKREKKELEEFLVSKKVKLKKKRTVKKTIQTEDKYLNKQVNEISWDRPKATIRVRRVNPDWSGDSGGEGIAEKNKESVLFNYKILSCSRRKGSKRHASLGPPVTSYTNPPIPLVGRIEKEDLHELLTSVVKRRQIKILTRPQGDPSKEVAVVPLVPEEDADPACTCGGSVVTGPEAKEVFSGVVVRQRKELADWNNGILDEEEELGELVKWDDGQSLLEYLETMWTAMCMEVGLTEFSNGFSEGEESDEEEYSEYESESEVTDSGDEDIEMDNNEVGDIDKCVVDEKVTLENVDDRSFIKGENDTGSISNNLVDSSVTSRKRPFEDDDSAAEEANAKRLKVQTEKQSNRSKVNNNTSVRTSGTISTLPLPFDKGIDSKSKLNVVKSPSAIATSESSINVQSSPKSAKSISVVNSPPRYNGISKSSSPVSTLPSSQSNSSTPVPSTMSTSFSSPTGTSTSTSSKKRSAPPPPFISPSRRSSRTPVPSAKLRDSLEDAAAIAPKSSKNRRSSMVSSDDDTSGGFSSDDASLAHKKKVKESVPL